MALPLPSPTDPAVIGYNYLGGSPTAIRKAEIAFLQVQDTTRLREGADPSNIDVTVDLIESAIIYGLTNGNAQVLIDRIEGGRDAVEAWLIANAAAWLS